MSSPENTIGRPADVDKKALAPMGDDVKLVVSSSRLAAPPPALAAAPNFFTLMRALRRRWLLAGSLGLVLGLAAAVAVWFLLPPAKNSANVQLHMNTDRLYLVHQHPDHIESVESYQSTQVALIKSRLVINAALREPKVAKLATFRDVPDPVEWLEREIRIDFPSREIIRISVTGEDIEDLKILANAVTKAYLTEVVDKQTKQRQTRLEELRKIQTLYKHNLANNRRAKEKLAEDSGAADAKTLGLMTVFLREQETAAKAQLIQVQQEIRKMEVSKEVTNGSAGQQTSMAIPSKLIDPQVDKDPSVAQHLVQIAALEDLIDRTERRANPNNHDASKKLKADLEAEQMMLKATRGRVRQKVEAQFREQMRDEGVLNVATLDDNIARAKALQKSLEGDIQRYTKAIKNAPSGQLNLQEMDFDIEQAENEVKLVTVAINQLEVELNAPPRVTPLQEAVAYKVDNFVRKAQLAVGAGFGILGLTLAGVAFIEFRSRRVNTVDEVVQGLGVRVVGTVPACPRRIRNGVVSDNVSYWKSMLAESVDAARTLLLHYARREDMRIVMITSACGGEGKTSLSSHLAVSMARSGRKTLLIDCDMRNPSSHKLFNVPLEPGLSSVLRGEISVEEALHPTQANGLWLMPAGACDGEALSMLARDGVQPVFDRLRREFDFIIIDSCPVLPVADALMVAQQVDGVIFAILREVSRLPKVHEAYQKLTSLGVRMLGAVVNGTSGEVYGYGYGYGSNSRYLTTASKN